MSDARVERFLRAWSGDPSSPDDGLHDSLREFLARAGTLEAGESEAFLEFLAGRLPAEIDPVVDLGGMAADDLLLVFRAQAGAPSAMRNISERLRHRVRVVAKRYARAGLDIDEVASALSERILVGTATRGRDLDSYSGRGPLDGWLRVTVARAFVNEVRRQRPDRAMHDDGALLAAMTDPGDSPELMAFKQAYRDEFKAAITLALGELENRDKGVLRLVYIQQVPIAQIAKMYDVHRGTVHRWLLAARDQVAGRAQEILRDRLDASGADLRSLADAMRSQLELSIERVLGADQ